MNLPRDLYFSLFDALVLHDGDSLDYASAARLGRTNRKARRAWTQYALRHVPLQLMRFYRGVTMRCAVYAALQRESGLRAMVHCDVRQEWLPRPLDNSDDMQCITDTAVHFNFAMHEEEIARLAIAGVSGAAAVLPHYSPMALSENGISRFARHPSSFFYDNESTTTIPKLGAASVTRAANEEDVVLAKLLCNVSFVHGPRVVEMAQVLLARCRYKNPQFEMAVRCGVPSALTALLALYVRQCVTYYARDDVLDVECTFGVDAKHRAAMHLLYAVASPFFALRPNVMLRRSLRYPRHVTWECVANDVTVAVPMGISLHAAIAYMAYAGACDNGRGTDNLPLYHAYCTLETYTNGADARAVRAAGGMSRDTGMGHFFSTSFDAHHPFFTTLLAWCRVHARGVLRKALLLEARVELGSSYTLYAHCDAETSGVVLSVMRAGTGHRLERICAAMRRRDTNDFVLIWTHRALELERDFVGSLRMRILLFVARMLQTSTNGDERARYSVQWKRARTCGCTEADDDCLCTDDSGEPTVKQSRREHVQLKCMA